MTQSGSEGPLSAVRSRVHTTMSSWVVSESLCAVVWSAPHCVCFSLQVALLNPIENPDLKLAIVMLIVPFFVNVSALLRVFPQLVPCLQGFLFKAPSVTQKSRCSPHADLSR